MPKRLQFLCLGWLAFLVTALIAAPLASSRADGSGGKLALVIQNDSYPDGEASAVASQDAARLAAALKTNGFDVELKVNLRRQELRASLTAFAAKIGEKSVALVYYRGVAIQVGRQNYLVPIDAAIWSEADVRRDGTSLDQMLGDLDRRSVGVKIAIVDAARPNPFERRFRTYSAGLAPASAPRGSLVLFAEALNRVGGSGKAPVSLFMTTLVEQIGRGGDAETVFSRIRQAVAKASEGRQLPWVASTLVEPFSFAASGAKPKQPAAPPPPKAQPKPPPPKPPQEAAAPPKPAAPAPPPLKPGDTFVDCKRCPEMAVLAAATFKMGSGTTPFDRPVHSVTIKKPFAMGLTAVTRDQWAVCVEAGVCAARPKTGAAGGGAYPVVEVDWADAEKYAAFLAKKTGKRYRLPTETEWEYAAHGGTTTAFAWGDAPGSGHANCRDCGGQGTAELAPTKTYPKNGFGLYDMAGNVAEWLQDCWTLTYHDAPTDGTAAPVASCKLRVVRGGSFETTSAYVKPTARYRAEAEAKSASVGFRVVRDLD